MQRPKRYKITIKKHAQIHVNYKSLIMQKWLIDLLLLDITGAISQLYPWPG